MVFTMPVTTDLQICGVGTVTRGHLAWNATRTVRVAFVAAVTAVARVQRPGAGPRIAGTRRCSTYDTAAIVRP